MDDGRAAGARSALPLQQQDCAWGGAMSEGANGGAQRLLDTLLRRSGLEHPDGRPLHRYKATDREAEDLGKLVRASFRSQPLGNGRYIAAAFCLFVAHWFQQHGGKGYWSWDRPAGALGASPDQLTRARLTDAGLGYWRRPLRRRDDGTHLYMASYMASLVIEGGLPRQVLTGSGWLGDYLARVIADLERGHHRDAEAASRHAHFHLHRVPPTFQDACLAELMGETALAVVDLRRETSERPAGVDPVLWLDTIKADWRAGFPIQIEDAAVGRLIEGLVCEAIAPDPETQLIERVARVRNGGIELGMAFAEAALADASVRRFRRELDSVLLARLVPDGRFADALDRVPAVLERLSSGDGGAWQARCTLPSGRRTVWGIDLATEARVSITYDKRVLGSWVLPGGEAADTGIAVFSLADEARTDELSVLRLIANGAARTRAREVAVLAPASWGCSLEPESRVERLATERDRQLVKLQGAAIFHTPDGMRHRIVTGADGDRAVRYFVAGSRLDDLDAAHPIVAGMPEFWQTLDQDASSRIGSNRIRVCQVHSTRRPWTALDADRLPYGLLQAKIDDGEGNASLLRFARVPAAARIEQIACGNGRSKIAFSCFEAATLVVSQPNVGTIDMRSDEAADRHEIIFAADTAVDPHCPAHHQSRRHRGDQASSRACSRR